MKKLAAILCLAALGGLNLKVLKVNEGGQPLLERAVNAENTAERITSYHPGGGKADQSLRVVSTPGKNLLYGKSLSWDSSGKITHRYVEDSSFDKMGGQSQGSISEKSYEHGRLVKERQQFYSPGSGSNETSFLQTVSYYDDGDMKERITEKPLQDQKERETWSEAKGLQGRTWAAVKWSAFNSSWD